MGREELVRSTLFPQFLLRSASNSSLSLPTRLPPFAGSNPLPQCLSQSCSPDPSDVVYLLLTVKTRLCSDTHRLSVFCRARPDVVHRSIATRKPILLGSRSTKHSQRPIISIRLCSKTRDLSHLPVVRERGFSLRCASNADHFHQKSNAISSLSPSVSAIFPTQQNDGIIILGTNPLSTRTGTRLFFVELDALSSKRRGGAVRLATSHDFSGEETIFIGRREERARS